MSAAHTIGGNPENARILAHNGIPHDVTVTTVDPVGFDERRAAQHPDIGERILNLGRALPPGSLIEFHKPNGFPAGVGLIIVHRPTATILSWSYGMAYSLRLLEPSFSEARKAGGTPLIEWNGNVTWDLRQIHGPDWLKGFWNVHEVEWLRATFEALDDVHRP